MIGAGYPVIIDATFLRFEWREQFRQLSGSLAVPFVLLYFEADKGTLCARIRSRQAAGADPSEAGIEVLEAQLASQERLTPDELADVIRVESSMDPSTGKLLDQIIEKIHVVTADRQPGTGNVVDL